MKVCSFSYCMHVLILYGVCIYITLELFDVLYMFK